jgi:hypothetical protein
LGVFFAVLGDFTAFAVEAAARRPDPLGDAFDAVPVAVLDGAAAALPEPVARDPRSVSWGSSAALSIATIVSVGSKKGKRNAKAPHRHGSEGRELHPWPREVTVVSHPNHRHMRDRPGHR